MDKQVRALIGVSRAREMLSREDALVASALIAGRLDARRTPADLRSRRQPQAAVRDQPRGPARRRSADAYEQYWASPDSEPLRTAEDRLIAAGPATRPAYGRRRTLAGGGRAGPRRARRTTRPRWTTASRTAAGPSRYSVLVKAGVAGVLGFLALLVSLFVSVRIGRDLVRDLSRLRKEAHEVSGVRLPSVMRRLAAGEQVDVETEAPRLEYEQGRDRPGRPGPQHPAARRRRGRRQAGRHAHAASPRSSSTSPAATRCCCTAS